MPQLSPEKYLVKPLSARQMRDSDIIIKDQDGNSECLEVSPDFAYSSKELVSFENAAVNIDSSTDVILGPVTQFNVNGNVTIVQNGPAEGEEKEKEKTIFEQKFPEKCDSGAKTSDIPKKEGKSNQLLWLLLFMSVVAALVSLIIVYAVNRDKPPPVPDDPDKLTPLILDRRIWGGRAPLDKPAAEIPVNLVVIKQTMGAFCTTPAECKDLTQQIQDSCIQSGFPDIIYNFLVGGDGNVYVGRGFGIRNQESNRTIDIALYGNYSADTFYKYMVDTTKFILRDGVLKKFISENYSVVCHNQTSRTAADVQHLYQEISSWEHFSNGTFFDYNN